MSGFISLKHCSSFSQWYKSIGGSDHLISSDSTPISFAKIVPDYEEMTPYKAQARNLKTGEIFSVGNFPTSVGATSNAISGCELLFKSQCILVKNNDIIID